MRKSTGKIRASGHIYVKNILGKSAANFIHGAFWRNGGLNINFGACLER